MKHYYGCRGAVVEMKDYLLLNHKENGGIPQNAHQRKLLCHGYACQTILAHFLWPPKCCSIELAPCLLSQAVPIEREKNSERAHRPRQCFPSNTSSLGYANKDVFVCPPLPRKLQKKGET